jgi:hypothetical protein
MDMTDRVEPHLDRPGEHPALEPAHVASVKPDIVRVRPAAMRWLLHDVPYILMLVLALSGIVVRLPFAYWLVLIPLFAVISTAMGWRHSATRDERVELVWRMALTWCALLLAIFLLFNSSVRGVLNANATALAMLTLLALGTFIAGIEAKEWRICAVGGLLFLAVPGLGWLDQSPLLLAAAVVVVVALGGMAWWISQKLPA